jgi:outer membrane biosynthesis protein TonB
MFRASSHKTSRVLHHPSTMSTGHRSGYNRNGSVLPKLYDEQNLSVDGPAPRSNRVRIFAILSVVLLVVVAAAVSLGVVLSKNDGGNKGKPVQNGATASSSQATEPSPTEPATDAPSSTPPREPVSSPSPTADQTPSPEPPVPPTSQARPSPSPAAATTPPPTSVTTPAPTWVPTIAAAPSGATTQAPTSATTIAAVPTNTTAVDQFLANLPAYSRELAASNASSPQAVSLEWLKNDPMYYEYELYRLNQRYALTVLYYSTSGRSWSFADRWVTWDSECAWYQVDARGADVCDEASRLSLLYLYSNGLDGSLPAELEMLTHLGGMYLYGALVGTIHTEM